MASVKAHRASDVESDYASHPGTLLAEEMEAREMTQKALAEALGWAPRRVGEIIRGHRPVTAEVALDLERVLGASARMWLRLQMTYDLAQARERRTARAS